LQKIQERKPSLSNIVILQSEIQTAEAGTSDTSRAQSADETTDESLPERGQGGVGNALLTVPEGTTPTQQG